MINSPYKKHRRTPQKRPGRGCGRSSTEKVVVGENISDDGGDAEKRGEKKGSTRKASRMQSQIFSFINVLEEISLIYAIRQAITVFLCIFTALYAQSVKL
jgi:hypothetical protein